MAELGSVVGGGWTAAQTRAQFAAIAWLRWRIMWNSYRRKGGAGEMVGMVLLSVLFLGMVLAFVVGAGFAAYFFVAKGHLVWITWLLWGIFLLCQLLNIQLGQPTTTFDPTQLIRFPLEVKTYVGIRLFFGLLTPANVAGTLTSLAVAVGIGLAAPGLWVYALIAMAVFAATNVLFSRMIFAWVDRWLSTRRAREVFTAVIFVGSLGIQWANFTFNPAYNHNHRTHAYTVSQQRFGFVGPLIARAEPWLKPLPPELASTSLMKAKQASAAGFAGYTVAAALWAGLFLLVFALRMRTEFRGENLSDAASAVARKKTSAKANTGVSPLRAARFGRDDEWVGRDPSTAVAPVNAAATGANPATSEFALAGGARVWSVIEAVIGKEILYVRRNTGILYGLVMPIFLVMIFAGKFATRSTTGSMWVFPAAVAYTLLAICPLSYNSLGMETTGAQLYFMAPVRMRDILLAKNLMGSLMAAVEILLIFVIISYMAGVPSLETAVAAIFWAVGTLAVNMIFGNQRSITSPKKMDLQKMARRQASQVSTLIALAVLMVSGGVAAGVFFLCFWLHALWALVPIFAVFAVVGVGLYLRSLKTMDRFALDHREDLLLELCKA
jgi:ABC-2 type transport system permease protein